MFARTRSLLFAAISLAGCGGGSYGHSRTYSPVGAEETALQGSTELDPVMAKRMPEEWAQRKVSVFGIVLKRDDADKGANVVISVRTLEPRNLCQEASEDSCRTTVSEREFDRIRVKLAFASPEDAAGENSIGIGSLLRVVGTIAGPGDQGGLAID